MIVKTLLAAIAAGLIAGVFMTAAQEMRVTPLILHAEQYEGQDPARPAPAASGDHHSALDMPDVISALAPVTPAYAHEHPAGVEHGEEGGILFGMNRFSGTLTANLVAGAGFGLLLAGLSLVTGQPLTRGNGLVWGALAWLAVHMLPAIGLPPELPGFPAAELGARQAWWFTTVLLSGVGLYLLAVRGEIAAKVVGLVLIAAPHVWGAPQPADLTSPVPAVLGAEFAVTALATTLAFWLVLGLVSGWLNDRFLKTA